MATVVPYINFADKGREQLDFYKAIFGGEFEISLVKDSSMAAQMPPQWAERIMHANFKAGDIRLMGSDVISDQAGLARGNGYSIAVMCDSVDQLNEWYDKLVEGGTAVMAPAASPWGSTFGQCADKYGVQWMLETS